MVEQRGVVLHIAEGSYEGTIAWQKNPAASVSSHFVVDFDGKIAQMVDTDTAAWTQAAGNGRWLSIENAGFHTSQFTPQQVEACAQILAKAHKTYGCPLKLANSPNEMGLGYHGMGGAAWGGHPDCPGPANVALRPTILARAIEIVNGVTPPPNTQEDDVPAVLIQDKTGIAIAWPTEYGMVYQNIGTIEMVGAWNAAGVPGPTAVPSLALVGTEIKAATDAYFKRWQTIIDSVDIQTEAVLTPEQLADIGDAAKSGAADGIDGARITTG